MEKKIIGAGIYHQWRNGRYEGVNEESWIEKRKQEKRNSEKTIVRLLDDKNIRDEIDCSWFSKKEDISCRLLIISYDCHTSTRDIKEIIKKVKHLKNIKIIKISMFGESFDIEKAKKELKQNIENSDMVVFDGISDSQVDSVISSYGSDGLELFDYIIDLLLAAQNDYSKHFFFRKYPKDYDSEKFKLLSEAVSIGGLMKNVFLGLNKVNLFIKNIYCA